MYSVEEQEYLLISDVDNTILGDSKGLKKFSLALSKHRTKIMLVYNSSRSIESIKRSLVLYPYMPASDYIVGNMGTMIEKFTTGKRDEEFEAKIRQNWNHDKIEEVLNELPFKKQAPKFQSAFKLSYYASPDLDPINLAKSKLSEYNLKCMIVYSSQRDIDFLPLGSGKGNSTLWLQQKLNFSKDSIIVAGDSANDLSMFKLGFHGIIVENAYPELKALNNSKLYKASKKMAAGLVEGLNHFSVFD